MKRDEFPYIGIFFNGFSYQLQFSLPPYLKNRERWKKRVGVRRIRERYAKGARKATEPPLTPLSHAASTLLSSSVAVTTTRKGTMNWDPTIRHTLPSSTTVVGLRILRHLAALPVSMFCMMTIDPCNQVSVSPIMSSLLYENEVDAKFLMSECAIMVVS
nr:uncharacterized protein LOC103406617 [Malus domestica]